MYCLVHVQVAIRRILCLLSVSEAFAMAFWNWSSGPSSFSNSQRADFHGSNEVAVSH